MRYAQPRKLNTKRGQLKAERNAWCWIHRTPMQRHGRRFACSGHWTVLIDGSGNFAKRSLERTGRTGRQAEAVAAVTKFSYPWCCTCHKRMRRLGRAADGRPSGFYCGYCRAIAGSRTSVVHFKKFLHQRQIKTMIRAGHLNEQISRTLHAHCYTIKKLRAQIPAQEVAHCKCGKLKFHTVACSIKPDIRTLLAPHRTEFDRMITAMNRQILPGLPEDVRLEIAQQMFLDVRIAVKEITKRAPEYLRRYNEWYNRLSGKVNVDSLKNVAG